MLLRSNIEMLNEELLNPMRRGLNYMLADIDESEKAQ